MIDTLLQNRYRLEAELGHGGMGTVYRAYDTLLDRPVAVKVVSNSALGTEGRARLLREARAAAKLNHPNIMTVHDAGEVDGTPFIVMELIEGHTLRAYPQPSLGTTIDIAQQICAALDHAHAKGIIHRDLKPENAMVLPNPHPLSLPGRGEQPHGGASQGVRVKLMDFGLAFSLGASRLTQEDMLIGTMAYLAPELIEGKPASPASDLYALGVMLYELTAGCLPFTSVDLATLLAQHLHMPVSPVSTHNPVIMPALDLLILRLLAKRPEQRPASAQEVLDILSGIGAGEVVVQPPAETPRHNLPASLTSFIGREKDMAEVKRLLSASRLVTLIGPGGAGKTRLSLQIAAKVLNSYPDGVWFIELAPLTDPALIPQTVASVLGLREEPGRPVVASLTDYVRAKTLLLILDNCEHLIEGCAQLANSLLRAAPQVRVLASSREPLSIAGEAMYRVPSLAVPDPQHLPPPEALAQYEAVRLFVERAQAALPSFVVSDTNASTVAQICYRLDGIPLALELAAARVRNLKVEQIAQRLGERFRLLTSGSRTALPHHQTLRALIDWSYDLLTEQERILFRRLSVFAGGWTIEATEVVGAGEGLETFEVLDTLLRLVDKSLVSMEEQHAETRYHMLETIRQYAYEKLLEAGESQRIRDHHLNYFLQIGEEAEPLLYGGQQIVWLRRLDVEFDNLRAALEWSLGNGDAESGLRLAGALWRFWVMRGHWSEGYERLKRALSRDSRVSMPARARALSRAGNLADRHKDFTAAQILFAESLTLCRELGDEHGTAFSLYGLGRLAYVQGDFAAGRSLLEESLTIYRKLEDKWGMALVLDLLSWCANDLSSARMLREESLAIFRELSDHWDMMRVLHNLGELARFEGDYARAKTLYEKAIALGQELDVAKWDMANQRHGLGWVALREGDNARATALFKESLILQKAQGITTDLLGGCLAGLGGAARGQGQLARAARLLGTAEAMLEITGFNLEPIERAEYDREIAAVRAQLTDSAFDAAWNAGQAMSLEQAIAYALEETA